MNKILFVLFVFFVAITTSSAQMNIAMPKYRANAEDINPLLIGKKLPELTLIDGIQLKKLLAAKPTILVFIEMA